MNTNTDTAGQPAVIDTTPLVSQLLCRFSQFPAFSFYTMTDTTGETVLLFVPRRGRQERAPLVAFNLFIT